MTTLTLKMTTTQIVETSVNVNNSPIQDYMITQTVMPHLLMKGLLVSNLSQLCNVSLIEANHINTLFHLTKMVIQLDICPSKIICTSAVDQVVTEHTLTLFLREHNNLHTVEPRYDKPLYKEAELAISTEDRQNHVSAAFLREDSCFYRKRRGKYKVLIKSQKIYIS